MQAGIQELANDFSPFVLLVKKEAHMRAHREPLVSESHHGLSLCSVHRYLLVQEFELFWSLISSSLN
jgi:hypothetical protein